MPEATCNDFTAALTQPLAASAGPGAAVAVSPAAPDALLGQDTRVRIGTEFVKVTITATALWTVVTREVEDAIRFPKKTWPAGTTVDVVLTAQQVADLAAGGGGGDSVTTGIWAYS